MLFLNSILTILLTHNNSTFYPESSVLSELILSDYYSTEYYKIVEFAVISLVLCLILCLVAYIHSFQRNHDIEKLSEYECGFEPFDSATRLPFDVHFYIVGIIFLVFDVEIAVLFPWALGIKVIGWYGFYTMLLFLFILTVGFFYEWQSGALNWSPNFRYTSLSFLFMGPECWEPIYRLLGETEWWSRIDSFLNFGPEVFFLIYIGYLFIKTSLIPVEKYNKRHAIRINNSLKNVLFILFIWYSFAASYHFSALFVPFENMIDSMLCFNTYMISDFYVVFIKVLIALASWFICLFAEEYFKHENVGQSWFSPLMASTTFFLLLLISSFNFIIAFISIIGFSLTLYPLILTDPSKHAAREAGIKYYFLSVFSAALFLFGMAKFYMIFETLNFMYLKLHIFNFFQTANTDTFYFNAILISLAIALTGIIITLLFKLSAAPCHFWAPEVYEGSPSPVMAYLILPVKIAVFAFCIRLLSYVFPQLVAIWQPVIIFAAVASMVIGCLNAYQEQRMKRFISYTSINQMGFLLLGLACANNAGYSFALIYLIIYMVMNFAFFSFYFTSWNRKTKNFSRPIEYIHELSFVKYRNAWQLFLFITVIFSMAGIPPLAGFFGKYYLLTYAFNAQLYGVVIIALIVSLISTFYYLRLLVYIFFTPFTQTYKSMILPFAVSLVEDPNKWLIKWMFILSTVSLTVYLLTYNQNLLGYVQLAIEISANPLR